jgi:hypothetical protein
VLRRKIAKVNHPSITDDASACSHTKSDDPFQKLHHCWSCEGTAETAGALPSVQHHRIHANCHDSALRAIVHAVGVQVCAAAAALRSRVLAFFEELATRERLVEEAHSSLTVHAMPQFSLY